MHTNTQTHIRTHRYTHAYSKTYVLAHAYMYMHMCVLSGERSISTGVPQGCVLSPVLFTLYTNDCTGTENTIFIKYSDDTAIVDL